jgi:hypothetical protein
MARRAARLVVSVGPAATSRLDPAASPYLPLVNFEAQPGIGLAIRKESLYLRGVLSDPVVRAPSPPMPDALRPLLDSEVMVEGLYQASTDQAVPVLGALGAATGMVLSIGGAWGIVHYMFELPFALAPGASLAIAAGMMLLTVVLGLTSGRRVMVEAPMAALREV